MFQHKGRRNVARTRYRFSSELKPFFITNTVVAWLAAFSYPQHAEILIESWRFLQNDRGIVIMGWVIMENHIHWIAAGPDLGKRVGEFKSYTAKSILRCMERRGYETLLQELSFYKLKHKTGQQHQFWQEGSHPQVIESDEVAWQKIEYIHNNPLRRGYFDDPTHWRYSSARSYAGQPGLLDVCVDWR